MESAPTLSPRENPLCWRLRGESNPRRCITQDSEHNSLPTELFRLRSASVTRQKSPVKTLLIPLLQCIDYFCSPTSCVLSSLCLKSRWPCGKASAPRAVDLGSIPHSLGEPFPGLVGPVVKASASRAEDPGFESRLRRDFSGVESYQRLKN